MIARFAADAELGSSAASAAGSPDQLHPVTGTAAAAAPCAAATPQPAQPKATRMRGRCVPTFSLSKTWNVAKLMTSVISSSCSIICWLTGAKIDRIRVHPPIAAGALLASDNERPAAPSTGTALLRRFR